jgi:hypothetical protein
MKVYCRQCDSVTSHRQKGVPRPVNVCNKCDITKTNIMLIREHDGLTKRGDQVKFVEWSAPELGSRGKKLHDEPQVGFSCIIDPQYSFQYTWLTTPITEIESDTMDKHIRCISFKTKNSSYKLYISKDE